MKQNQYNKLAQQFLKANNVTPEYSRTVLHQFLEELDLEGKVVLEEGSGPGVDLQYILSKGAKTYGIDSAREMVELSKQTTTNVDIRLGTINKLPYQDGMFDIIYSRYTLQHLWTVQNAFKEAYRVLKNNGVFLIGVTHPFRHYFEKETKDYWKKEWISSTILGGHLVVREPSHTFEEYFSSNILQLFSLEKFKEIHEPTADQINGVGKYPGVAVIQYRKK